MVPFRALIAFIALAAAGATSGAACAQDASAWVQDAHSSLRLLAGSRTGAVRLGGIEIQLQPGWKTYWRTPGDSGVPPRFDFSKSVNVESVTPLYPSPKKFDDGAGGMSYGYIKHVIFPLRIVPKNPNEPVQLRASVSYAVCECARQRGRDRAQQGTEAGRHIRGDANRIEILPADRRQGHRRHRRPDPGRG
jgi:DsbC/DsbD-like thiol-disulfide interchange protein